jgi:hypothetical protein
MRNITLSADDATIEAARKRAAAEGTTINEQFRIWLAQYADQHHRAERALKALRELQKVIDTSGPKPTRDELNAR